MQDVFTGVIMNKRKSEEIRVTIQLSIIRQLLATREQKLFRNQNITSSQFAVLHHFINRPDRAWTVTELANVMEMNQPGITKILSVMETKGFLLSEKDSTDTRKKNIRITEAGINQVKVIGQSMMPDITYRFASWDDEELAGLLKLNQKLLSWLDEHRDVVKTDNEK